MKLAFQYKIPYLFHQLLTTSICVYSLDPAWPWLHHRVQNGSGAHPASNRMGTRGSFPGDKAARAWSWPLTTTSAEVKECVELYLHSFNTPPWRGA